MEVLRSLHECVEHSLRSLYQVSVRGFPVATTCRQKKQLHLLLPSSVADLPEAGGLLSVRRGSRTFMPYYICIKTKQNLSNCTKAQPRSPAHTEQTFRKLESREGLLCCNETLKNVFLCPLLPVVSTFPFVGIRSLVGLYTMFRQKPMHVFSLGVSEMLKECLIAKLGDQRRMTSSIKSSRG